DPSPLAAGKDSTGTTGIGSDTTTMTLDTFQTSTKTPNGIYQAILPCSDCKGIEHTVSFSPDLTYRLEENKIGKKGGLVKTAGNWRANQGKVILYKNDTVMARYTWQGDTLRYLKNEGSVFSLRKVSPAADNPAWQKKGQAGVEFYGVGNEPFWSVEIDEEKTIAFHLAEWSKPLRFPASPPVIFPDSTVYVTTNDSVSLRLVILNEFCSDGMSDYIYTEKIKVLFGGQAYSGCGLQYTRDSKEGAAPRRKSGSKR
ncbi:MAG TPA: copper resistance protein NlpE N-terminal domain-containing protein, partial [Flavisolibacter sp.]|nr:copper resistance protein NlpE N-terminal domain-containing protein [Flavisolibacter sp.]